MRHIALATGFALVAAGAAQAQTNLRFQSSDPAGNPNFELQQGWTETVEEMTDGEITIDLLPVDSIVAHSETMDAISAGILDGHITDTSYFAGKDAAFGLIANPVGAWSDPQEMFDFMENGGGYELMNELENPYGLQFVGATTPGLEAFVSSVPLDGVDDLQGLKLRAPEGLVQRVFAAAGAAPVNLPGSEVFTALDKGTIDAADYNVLSTNDAQGLHDVAPHPVYPGFHSMPLIEISMNKQTWDGLSPETQETLRESVRQFRETQIETVQEANEAVAEDIRAGDEVTIHDWSDEERAKFRAIATDEWEQVAGQSQNAQKVYDTLTSYLEEQGMLSQ